MACLQYLKCILSVCIWCFALCLSLFYFLELETYFEGFGIKYKTYLLFLLLFICGLKSSASVWESLDLLWDVLTHIGTKTRTSQINLNILVFLGLKTGSRINVTSILWAWLCFMVILKFTGDKLDNCSVNKCYSTLISNLWPHLKMSNPSWGDNISILYV